MSHFTVLITRTEKESVDSQLAPYYEQGDDGDYFMERQTAVWATDMEKEANRILGEYESWHKEALEEQSEAKRKLAGDISGLSTWEISTLETKAEYDGNKLDTADETREKIANKQYQEVVQGWHGGEIDNAGNLYFLTNPSAKWDWWVIGGRWKGFFKLKDGIDGHVGESGVFGNEATYDADIAMVKEIDWDFMKAQNRKRAEEQWAEYEKEKAEGKDPRKPGVMLSDATDDKETYLKKSENVSTFAVLHDGEWHEQGEMGWFAIVSDEKEPEDWEVSFWKIINSLDPDTELTVVDCHI